MVPADVSAPGTSARRHCAARRGEDQRGTPSTLVWSFQPTLLGKLPSTAKHAAEYASSWRPIRPLTASRKSNAMRRAILMTCLLLFSGTCLALIATTRFPSAFDELEHVSYAAYLQETGRLLPRFEEQKTLSPGDLSRWDDRPNYLAHPSPFYLLMAMVLDRTLQPGQAILMPRLASAGLLLLGVALEQTAG